MEVRAGYKQTEIGVFPDDWKLKRLQDISPSQSVGLVINPSTYFDDNGTVPMLVGSNIEENRINWETAKRITTESNKSIPASQLRANDLVTVRVGEPGTTAVVPPELDGCNCASMMIVRQHPSFNSQWLSYMMNSKIGIAQIRNVQYGTAQKQFNISDAINFIYPVPSLTEQEAIATALSDADALIKALEQLLTKKRQIKLGVIHELLMGKRRLPGFEKKLGYQETEAGVIPADWTTLALENAAINLVRGPFGGALKKAFFVEKGYKVYEQGNAIYETSEAGDYFIDLKKYKELERFRVQPGDFIVSCAGTIGRIYRIPKEAPEGVINQALLKISINPLKINEAYFLAVFKSNSFQERIKENTHGGAMQNLVGMDVFRKTLLPSPPTLAEQTAIAEILSDMDAEITALEGKLSKARQVKAGMMSELLTGRIRLIDKSG